ncbi:stage II sporulation protein M [Candidatus Woesearchaeota archaeon]|nr:stage II sporulation protein M [Candidatus Woesearchaeota archaeon]
MLEHLFPHSWIRERVWLMFFLGFAFSVVGMGSALILFPGDAAFPAIAFTALLSLPSLNRLLAAESGEAASEERFDLLDPFRNHADIFGVYLFLFLGVLLAFSVFALLLPGIAANELFSGQLAAVGLAGKATGAAFGISFASVFFNNFLVFCFAFLASFIYGSGSVFVIIWNASVWGVVFGSIAREASLNVALGPLAYFGKMMLAVSPHMITEASAYVLAAIAGGIVSQAIIREKFFSARFSNVVQAALVVFLFATVLLVASAYIETGITYRMLRLLGLGA